MRPAAPLTLMLDDESDTVALAQKLADLLCDHHAEIPKPGGRIHLRGELGTGKTTLARALLRAAGVQGRIKSPSYALLESYNVSSLYFYHFDFYRFSDAQEWQDAGFRELLDENAIVLIEWPEQAGAQLPPPDLDILLEHAGTGRRASIDAYSDKGRLWLTQLTPSRP
ncbi:MAG TPA: tRNA (adenosine(37)-N6)-threonylcarbamoyltransferase complex ATPase subunit type 1 TsaE [Castellaniella sp.]|nr:tRNA (adenosine(37)-N6)-threonylcarbamoyltransferase complex ATPase subunit type 1 TsaE [Castellaniella sp.]